VAYEEAIHTKHWAVELNSDIDPNKVAEAHGLRNMGPIGTLKNVYLFEEVENNNRKRSLEGEEEEEDIPHISTSEHVSWLEKQVAKMRFKRFDAPTDPLYNNQWHLHNPNGVDINVIPAWSLGYSGRGVNIAVVDDGLQSTHPDIANYNAAGSYDFNQGDADPTPHYGDDHGTSAAGVAAAKRNSACGVGAGYEAGLSGIRLISDFTTDAQEAAGLSYRKDINFIYTNSWGPNDDGRRLEGPGSLTLRAMEDAVTNGRNKKGSIYVWAGGNGKSGGDNANYDGYANSRFSITIGATDYMGKQSYYSEPCACLLASAPSSGSARSITTTDLLGNQGTSSTDCTSTFGGTSAAAPLVAGVVALMLEANPNLGWRDVQQIFVNTSKLTDPSDSNWFVNGGGYHHNHKYGFGIVDAGAAVQQALRHVNLPEYKNVHSGVVAVNKALNDNQPVETGVEINENIVVETVEVYIVAQHQVRGDLTITLTSPFGTVSVLQETHNDRNANINWKYATVRSWGESSRGKWTVTVEDKRSGNSGSFTSFQLVIYGH
jgi:subtilisin family serine protease